LTARLDRLGPAREVAQIGAVIGRDFSYCLLRDVAGIEEAALQTALDRLAEADILLVQGLPPEAYYRFKHALIQDAAYENLLKSRRQALHRRVAETLLDGFADTAGPEPELLAYHFTRAGLTEAAIEWWAKSGHRSLERSAMVEAAEQLTRALDLMATLPATAALRREQIKLQVALITPLLHVKGFAAPETKAAAERARLLIEQAEGLGEPPEDPLLLYSVLYSFWVANIVAFNGDVIRELAAQFLTLAEQQRATVPLMIGHRLMGMSLVGTGAIAESREHLDRAITLYNPAEHRPLATRFGQDLGVSILSYRSLALWFLGYPNAALAAADRALKDAREIGQAATLMYTLNFIPLTHICCGEFATAKAQADEVVALADKKGSLFWKAFGMMNQGCVLALIGRAPDAVQIINSGITAWQSTGATLWAPFRKSLLAKAYAELDQFEDAWRCISQAMTIMEATKERWCEADINRIAGEIAMMSPERDVTRAEDYFDRALTVARQQQAKSWELRAAMSLARLWRDQNKQQQARELLAPVYGWFNEGFDTRDLKEAKALLEELAA
jgi:predicted ATPase